MKGARMKKSHKRTKILITLGPASSSPQMIEKLLRCGADCFRVNFSHGTTAEHAAAITTVRTVGKKLGVLPGILCDLQGPKIRTGRTPGDAPVTLTKGSRVTLTNTPQICSASTLYINYPRLFDDLSESQSILINDGAIRLTIVKIDLKNRSIACEVANTGTFSSRKGVNFPGAHLSVPSLTAKDKKDLAFILDQDINYIALSFVRRAEDVTQLTRRVQRARKDIAVIAKIEKPEALLHSEEIMRACSGIMVARGDLGVETSPYEIAVLQKNLINEANRMGKIVIVATQMLESMIEQPQPTRAESTDVANAILDGADAMMLSGETSIGTYPVAAVHTMATIARVTEASPYYPADPVNLTTLQHHAPHVICEAAAWASRDLGHVPVIIFTASGDTALYLSKTRNQSRIFAFTPFEQVAGMLSLAWNVTPFVLPFNDDLAELQKASERILLARGLVKNKAVVLMVGGTIAARGATNFLRAKKVGEL
jgi:pyruvate kinase